MPFETVVDVSSEANIVTPGIGIAANDVNEPVSNASHAITARIDRGEDPDE
jgi:hypothetical protein